VMERQPPSHFGAETGKSSGSGMGFVGTYISWISMSSRFEKKERKYDSCRGVHVGNRKAMNRSVGKKCPK
jgi:hypothetical protein